MSIARLRKLRPWRASLFAWYTSAVLLNTLPPNSPRQSQLASKLSQVLLLRTPRVKVGLALPRTCLSASVASSVLPPTHPALAATQANSCLPAAFTSRNTGPKNVPIGWPTMMRCEYWLDCPWPLTKPVLMYGTPPMLVTLLLSFVSTRPPLNDLFAFFQSNASTYASMPLLRRLPTFSMREDTTAGCGTATSSNRS